MLYICIALNTIFVTSVELRIFNVDNVINRNYQTSNVIALEHWLNLPSGKKKKEEEMKIMEREKNEPEIMLWNSMPSLIYLFPNLPPPVSS